MTAENRAALEVQEQSGITPEEFWVYDAELGVWEHDAERAAWVHNADEHGVIPEEFGVYDAEHAAWVHNADEHGITPEEFEGYDAVDMDMADGAAETSGTSSKVLNNGKTAVPVTNAANGTSKTYINEIKLDNGKTVFVKSSRQLTQAEINAYAKKFSTQFGNANYQVKNECIQSLLTKYNLNDKGKTLLYYMDKQLNSVTDPNIKKYLQDKLESGLKDSPLLPLENIIEVNNLLKLNGSDHVIWKRMQNGEFDYDLGALSEISPANEFQKSAFEVLLDSNNDKRFEALAIRDIIEQVTDENSLTRLKESLKDQSSDAHSIIQSLKKAEGTQNQNAGLGINKATDRTPVSNTGKIITEEQAEKEVIELLGLHKDKLNDYGKKIVGNLVKLYTANPHRYQKMVDSGLLDLIREKKIGYAILNEIDDKKFLSNRTLQDIKKIRDGEPLIKTLSSSEELTSISNHVANGDVCEVDGHLYVNDGGTAKEIKLSREKFEGLFPPLSRVSFQQGQVGDCWFVSTLDNLMDVPKGRSAIYSLFEQQGNDIVIKFPDGRSVRFADGKVLDANGAQIKALPKSENPVGVQMIEQAYAVHRLGKADTNVDFNNITGDLADAPTLMQNLKSGLNKEAVKAIVGENTSIEMSVTGGTLATREKLRNLIITTANDENTLTFLGTNFLPGGDSKFHSIEYNLAGKHAYSIKGYNETTEMVYCTNPWNTSGIIEIPLYELIKHIKTVTIAKL